MLNTLAYAHNFTEHRHCYDFDYQLDSVRDTPCFFVYEDSAVLSKVLMRANRRFIETSHTAGYLDALAFLDKQHADFSVALNSQLASFANMSHVLTHAINDRLGLNLTNFANIQSCLQEALTNSLVHGNLCINRTCETLDDFDDYYQAITEKLADPYYQHMRIYLLVWIYGGSIKIGLSHEGRGRLTDAILHHCNPRIQQKTGRGLYLIQTLAQQVWCNDNGKSLYFTFPI